MTKRAQSVWLGPARNPIRWGMLISVIGTALLVLWLVFSNLFLGSSIGLKQFLSPAENLMVFATLVFFATSVALASIYFSDTRGTIEIQPAGFFDVVSLICSRLAMVGTTALVFVMFFEVVSRYVFHHPTLWANELSLWIAGFIFLLSGLYAMQQRSHIRIYIIYDIMPRFYQKTADVISVLLIWTFAFLLIWGGYNEALSKFLRWETFGTAWDPPIPATMKPAILIIVLLVAIQALSNLIADWNKQPEGNSAEPLDEKEIEIIRQSLKD